MKKLFLLTCVLFSGALLDAATKATGPIAKKISEKRAAYQAMTPEQKITIYEQARQNTEAAFNKLPKNLKNVNDITAAQAIEAFKAMRLFERSIWLTLDKDERRKAREMGCPGGVCILGHKRAAGNKHIEKSKRASSHTSRSTEKAPTKAAKTVNKK